MARMWTSGCEIEGAKDSSDPQTLHPDGTAVAGSPQRYTLLARTGNACWQMNSGVGSAQYVRSPSDISMAVANTKYFGRVYLYFSHFPNSTVGVLALGGVGDISVRCTSGGVLQLMRGTTQIGSDSAALSLSTWYCVEVSATTDAGTVNFVDAEARLDLTSFASGSGFTQGRTGSGIYFGWLHDPGGSKTLQCDDVALNDFNSPVGNASWPGSGKVILMVPTSDAQRGSWTGGAGGTTNLFAAIDNTPPVGVAAETDTSQIENADSSPDNATDEYRGNCGSYTTAGVGSLDTINSIEPWINDGQDVLTGTKTGSFGLQSNPSQTYVNFTFDDDVAAAGTYPVGWEWHKGTIEQAPTVTKGSNLVIACRKTDTGTRTAFVDFLGAYVDYTPFVATGLAPPPKSLYTRMAHLIRR